MTGQAKKLARLAAVQVLYQDSYEQEDLALILKRYTQEPSLLLNGDEADEPPIMQKPDTLLLSQIAYGVVKDHAALSEMVMGAVDQKISAARLENLLRSILLAGAFELYNHTETDAALIISDYVDVARAFFNGKEPGLVNAVLDKLAKKLRPD
ncbi:MAG: hypothetical protein FWF24_03615 [Alphaproteobacteria bacterium]|nr:hypothetical protein [Alphaproteobacteria bacterium]